MQTQNRDFDYETKKGGPSEVGETEYPEKGIRYYQALVNQKSLDGLPGLKVAFKTPLTSVIKERLQPINQPSTLSKVRKVQKEEQCKSGCESPGVRDDVVWIKADYRKKAEEVKYLLLAFFFGLAIATYLPPAAKAIGPCLLGMENPTSGFAFPLHSSI